MKSIGVDIGANHIACGLYNKFTDKLENKIYIPNKINKNTNINVYTKYFINLLSNLIDRLIKENNISINKISSIGFGCPGGVDKENAIFLGSSSINIEKIEFRKEFKKYNVCIFIENDSTCAGICESYFSNVNNFLMFTLGSDLGVSYIENYKCIDKIVWDIIEINKKNNGSYNNYINSFYSLSQQYNKIKNNNYERNQIFKSIKKGDSDAINILKDYIKNFIIGIKRIEQHYNIKDILLGGGMSEYSKYFLDDICKKLPQLNICASKFKNDSGIIGAALLENFI